MKWDESMSVGYEIIDTQHRELFELVDSFRRAMKEGRGREEVLEVLDFMEKYAIRHFTAEESVQKNHNYPKYAEHAGQHRAFVKEVEKIRGEIRDVGVTSTTAALLSTTLTNWLVTHITKHDKAIGVYIKSLAQ